MRSRLKTGTHRSRRGGTSEARGPTWDLTSFLRRRAQRSQRKTSGQLPVLGSQFVPCIPEKLSDRLRSWPHQFHINCYGHIVANRSARPVHAEVYAVDRGHGGSSHVEVASWVLNRRGGAVDVEDDFLSHAVNREIAHDF